MVKDLLLLVLAISFLLGVIGSVIYYFALLFKVAVPNAFEQAPAVTLFSLIIICLISFVKD